MLVMMCITGATFNLRTWFRLALKEQQAYSQIDGALKNGAQLGQALRPHLLHVLRHECLILLWGLFYMGEYIQFRMRAHNKGF